MSRKNKQRITGGGGTGISFIWAAYSHLTTVKDLPKDASDLAKMIADPPLFYLPWLFAVGFVLLLAWSFWPSDEDDEGDDKGHTISGPNSAIISGIRGKGHNINIYGPQIEPEKPESKKSTYNWDNL